MLAKLMVFWILDPEKEGKLKFKLIRIQYIVISKTWMALIIYYYLKYTAQFEIFVIR